MKSGDNVGASFGENLLEIVDHQNQLLGLFALVVLAFAAARFNENGGEIENFLVGRGFVAAVKKDGGEIKRIGTATEANRSHLNDTMVQGSELKHCWGGRCFGSVQEWQPG